jgi:YidC/Oxa1 family membrane protein insertase
MLTDGSDDQRRLLLALALSLGLFLGVQYLFSPPRDSSPEDKNASVKSSETQQESNSTGSTEDNPESEQQATSDEDQSIDTTEQSGPQESGTETDSGQSDKQEKPRSVENGTPKKTVLENEKLRVTFSNNGATLSDLVLKDYYRTADQDEKVHLFDDRFRSDTISFSVRRNDPEREELSADDAVWTIVESSSDSVVYRYITSDGLQIDKTFSLPENDSHVVEYDIEFSATGNALETGQLKLYSPGGIVLQSKQDQSYHLGLYGYKSEGEWTYENDIGKTSFSDGELEVRDVTGEVWTGLTTKYFASIFIPQNRENLLGYRFEQLKTDQARTGNTSENPPLKEILHPDKSMIAHFVTSNLELASGESESFSFTIYNGPKKESILNEFKQYGLPNLINYGMFGFISSFFISILNFLYQYIGNYGLAILFLTLVVKLCLHPITKKAQVSMHKMKDLQPKIEELQEKYEDDRQKLGEEQMKLFKEHDVNPLGGCLPMVCQIPVLIGLYYGIRVSFQVRQKPFMLWVNDLSQPDHFMEIGMGTIMGLDFQYLNLLIIFMMATWLIQSLTHPSPSGDGQAAMQQNMMKFMPMIFGVICYNFPSGLVLYWMMSTLFSALEQLYIRNIVLPSS